MIFKWSNTPCYSEWNHLKEPVNFFNLLIVWNNQLGVDVRLTEKPGASLAQGETENCPKVKSYVKMQILFLKFIFSYGVFLTFLIYQINYLVSLANVKDLFNVNISFICKYKCEYKR